MKFMNTGFRVKHGLLVYLLLALVLAGSLATLYVSIFKHSKRVNTQAASSVLTADGLNLRLPWPSGSHGNNGGFTYNCGDHLNSDQYALDFGLHSQPVSAVFSGVIHIGQYDKKGFGNNLWIDHG